MDAPTTATAHDGILDSIWFLLPNACPTVSCRVVTHERAPFVQHAMWVQGRAREDGLGTTITPEIVMNYASAPINLLAQEWHDRFVEWEKFSKAQQKHPVPPVFIVVCRDTAVAREVHDWLANGNDGYGVSPPWFKNAPGQEVTVRIDSKVIEDIEDGGSKDENKRLRFILESVGKSEWPGGKVPEDWSEVVRKHNDKAESDDKGSSINFFLGCTGWNVLTPLRHCLIPC